MKPRANVQALRQQTGGPEDLKALQERMRMRSDTQAMGSSTASLVNYASALPGSKKYDAAGLTR
jgi:hypothetical protein